MGGKSKSSADTTQSQQTTNSQTINTSTVGLDNVETGVVGSNNSITRISTTTDQGAVEAGRRIGEAALDTVRETTEGAYGLARESLGTVEHGLDAALDFGSGLSAQAFAFGSQALKSTSEQATQTTNVLAGAIDRASQATRSDTADTLQKVTKSTMIVVGVMVAAVAAVLIFGGKK
jgi:hypothetical protein